jgi:hypothetical protein
MKNRIFALLACAVLAGCAHGQQPVTPPVTTYTCPTPGTAYMTLNAAGSSTPPTTATTYTAKNVTGQTCFIAQGYLPASGSVPAQTGSWSNTAGPTVGGTGGNVNLSVSCTAGTGQTCSGVEWEFSSAPATAVTALAPAVPSMGAPTSSMLNNEKYTPQPVDCKTQNSTSCAVPMATLTASK